jgi:hypothetical protein
MADKISVLKILALKFLKTACLGQNPAGNSLATSELPEHPRGERGGGPVRNAGKDHETVNEENRTANLTSESRK